jgi:vacuolar-type H+-ATPase subunit H
MTEAPAPSGDPQTVEALRRVKAVEAEWEAKLRSAREETEQAVRRARDEAEATVKAVQTEVEREHARRLEAAAAAADSEASAIRADGETAAAKIRGGQGRRAADRADEIVAAVLGPFASE